MFKPQLLSCLKGYNRKTFSTDLMSGVIVGIVALPLAIAFGIASGVGPTEGIMTAIVAGFLISLLGGSKVQIGGPTGAFIVIVYGVIQEFGLSGLMVSTVMAGILLVLMGVFKLGNIIKFVPYPVIVGFTGGIAVTILTTQIPDFFGLQFAEGAPSIPGGWLEKIGYFFKYTEGFNWISLAIGVLSVLVIVFTPKISKKIPGSLMAIIIMTLAAWLLTKYGIVKSNAITTIGNLYELPSGIPAPKIPQLTLAEGQTFWDMVITLFPTAFTIAMLGAIESLLSAMVADGVTGDKHDSNTELIGQGVANIVTPFFGGIPATGAIARTMTNINNGGKTPVSGIIHAIVLLLILLLLGPLVGFIPMACLAGVLVIVSYNMSGWRSFIAISKNPRADFAVLIVTFLLTVIFDLTIAIEVGLLLAIVLFLKRTNEAVSIRSFHNEIDPNDNSDIKIQDAEKLSIPDRTDVYEIDGPYFFGIANKFEEITRREGYKSDKPLVRIIRMRKVAFIDSTGIHNLEILCNESRRDGIQIVLSGVNNSVHDSLQKAGLIDTLGAENVCSHINFALERAKEFLATQNA